MRSRGRWLVAILALPMLLTTGVAPSSAANGRFTASLVGMDPALPATGDALVLNLQLSNSTAQAISDIRARFLISTAPLRGRSEIPDVISGQQLPTYRTLNADAASGISLASGASTTLVLRTTTEQIGLATNAPGVYVFGLAVNGTANDGKAMAVRTLTLLPWMPKRPSSTLGVTTTWTLTAPPSRSIDGVFMNDSLARDLQTDGRLRRQLDAMAAVSRATWLIDPMLVESVQALAGGARIRQEGGDIRAATDAEMADAQRWLTDLKQAVSTGTVAALPLADLDLRAAIRFSRLTMLRHALSTASQRLATAMQVPTAPLVVPVYGGAISDSTWRLFDELGAVRAIVPDSAYPATQQFYTPSTSLDVRAFGRPVLVVDQAASTAAVTTGISEMQRRQALAAQLLMTYLERPNDPRVIALAIPPTWTPQALGGMATVLTAPWIEQIDASTAAKDGFTPRTEITRGASGAQREQNGYAASAVRQQSVLRDLTSDAAFSTTVDDAVSALFSTWWTVRSDGREYANLLIDELTTLGDSVRVVTRGDIVFGGERGNVPVTVANGLPVPVDVRLQAMGLPSARVQTLASTELHLNAGRRVSVEIPTRVTGSGDAYVLLQVVAGSGSVVGVPTLLTVRSAAYARIASYVVAVSFAALLLLVAVNTVRRMRLRKLGLVEEE